MRAASIATVVVLVLGPTLARADALTTAATPPPSPRAAPTSDDDMPISIGGGLVIDGGGDGSGVLPSIEALVRVRGDADRSLNLRARFGYGVMTNTAYNDGGIPTSSELQVLAGLEGHLCGSAGAACFVVGASAGYENQGIVGGIAGFGAGGTVGFQVGSATTQLRLVLDITEIQAQPKDDGLDEMTHWATMTSASIGVIHQL